MSPVQIAAVVVTYQSASTIDACLLRLRAAEGISEIRVVDNASSDDTVDVVQRHALADPRVHFIANPDNPGFATACNQGARDSQAPWLVFIPGAAIIVLALAFNLVGDALRDILDPTQQGYH